MSSKRPIVFLVGASLPARAQIALQVPAERIELANAASLAELTQHAVASADVFLVWDDGKAIAQLQAHLAILAQEVPIIAVGQSPAVRQVVAALVAGALDYLEWPCSAAALMEAVTTAIEARARRQPLRARALEARRQLSALSRRERQILTAMAQGMSSRAIAEVLEIEVKAIDRHRQSLLAKLAVEHSAEAIRIELEATLSSDWRRDADWMAPWTMGDPLTRTG